MRRTLSITALTTLCACGGGSEDSSKAPPVERSPPPASTVLEAMPMEATVDSVYARFLPPELCSMQRRDMRVALADLVTARYEKDDVTLHVNVGKVDDLELGRSLYQREYQRVVRGPWGIYTRAWTLDSGEQNREACIIVRNSINVCLDILAMARAPPDPAPCLVELDLPGLVELAVSFGGASGLADLDFTKTEEEWQAHAASLGPGWSEYERACTLHAAGKPDEAAAALVKSGRGGDQPIDFECRMLDETRADCERDAFDERLAQTDIHLRPKERENFRRTWEITCTLARKGD